jgi:tripartite-type tricarboxylate transporter receptor subunit TctC
MRRLALAAILAILCATAAAQSRPTRIIVPFAVGGASDTYTRIVAQKITEQTGKAFVVENHTGAGGRIAWELAAKSAPDGATIALIDATYPMLPGLFASLPWDVAGDLIPAALIAQTPFVIMVNAESKLPSLAALLAQARANPGKLNYGSSGVGSVNQVVSELFKHDAKISLAHIPYKGMSEASVALQGGFVDLIIAASPTALGPVKGGKARALAVTTAQRSAAFPGVPTAREAGVADYVVTNWFGFAVPKGTPRDIINTLRDDVVRALAAPDVRDKLGAQGAEASNFTADEFAGFLRDETRRWTEVIKASGIKAE